MARGHGRQATVAGLAQGVESGATALAVDGVGNYITAGYSCGEPCAKAAELRAFAPGGAPLGVTTLAANLITPLDLAHHPAGYVAP